MNSPGSTKGVNFYLTTLVNNNDVGVHFIKLPSSRRGTEGVLLAVYRMQMRTPSFSYILNAHNFIHNGSAALQTTV